MSEKLEDELAHNLEMSLSIPYVVKLVSVTSTLWGEDMRLHCHLMSVEGTGGTSTQLTNISDQGAS